MRNVREVLDLFAGAGGLAGALMLGVLLLVCAVVFWPGKEPHRRLLALVRAWRGRER